MLQVKESGGLVHYAASKGYLSPLKYSIQSMYYDVNSTNFCIDQNNYGIATL